MPKVPETMQALIIPSPREARVEEALVPRIGRGQVLVKLEGCGVCGSNLPVWQGRPWFEYPRPAGSPGHEGWGTVVALGEGVSSVQIGDRVTSLSGAAYAEYDAVNQNELLVLPQQLGNQAVPGEPLGCAMNVFRRSGVEPGQTVVVVGVGFLGSLLIELAVEREARVIAVSRRPYALEVARQKRAEVTLAWEDDDAVHYGVQALTSGQGAECVIEAVGSQAALTLASKLVRERGRLVIAGFHQDGLRQVDVQSWNWRGIDVINAHERDPAVYVEGMRRAVEAIVSGSFHPESLYSYFSLNEAGAALRALETRPNGFMKGVVVL